IAFINKALHYSFGVFAIKKGPVPAPLHALHQDRKLGPKPDCNTMLADGIARARVHISAAAGCQNLRAFLQQPRDDTSLTVPEIRRAMIRKDLRDGLACSRLDLVVGVYEAQTEPLCQAASHCGLPGTHQTNENDAPRTDVAGNGLGMISIRCQIGGCHLPVVLPHVTRCRAVKAVRKEGELPVMRISS